MASLVNGFFKYRHDPYKDRVLIFLKKVKNNLPFSVQTDTGIKEVILNSDWYDYYKNLFDQNVKPNTVVLEDNSRIKFNNLIKTTEFGGEPSGFRRKKENTIFNFLQKQIIDAKGNKEFITIKILKQKYKISDIVHYDNYNCKADFALKDINNNHVVFISHKDGFDSPREFGQWSGISYFIDHPEVKNFIEKLSKIFPCGIDKGSTAVYRKINDIKLKQLAMYGCNFDNGLEFNAQNVTMVMQGVVKLVKTNKNYYTLECNNIWYNGEIVTDDYEPVLLSRYANDRNDGGLNCTRITMYPIGGRKIIPLD